MLQSKLQRVANCLHSVLSLAPKPPRLALGALLLFSIVNVVHTTLPCGRLCHNKEGRTPTIHLPDRKDIVVTPPSRNSLLCGRGVCWEDSAPSCGALRPSAAKWPVHSFKNSQHTSVPVSATFRQRRPAPSSPKCSAKLGGTAWESSKNSWQSSSCVSVTRCSTDPTE